MDSQNGVTYNGMVTTEQWSVMTVEERQEVRQRHLSVTESQDFEMLSQPLELRETITTPAPVPPPPPPGPLPAAIYQQRLGSGPSSSTYQTGLAWNGLKKRCSKMFCAMLDVSQATSLRSVVAMDIRRAINSAITGKNLTNIATWFGLYDAVDRVIFDYEENISMLRRLHEAARSGSAHSVLAIRSLRWIVQVLARMRGVPALLVVV